MWNSFSNWIKSFQKNKQIEYVQDEKLTGYDVVLHRVVTVDAIDRLKEVASGKKLFSVNYFEYRDQFDRNFEKCPSLTRIKVRDAIELLVKHINSSGFNSEHVLKTLAQLKDIQNGEAKVARFGLQLGVVFV